MRFSTIIRLSLGRAVISKSTHRFLKSSAVLNESEMSVHPIAESGFTSSELYDRVRPGYSKEAVTFLLHKLGVVYGKNATSNMQPTHILELGAGTGKFTRTLQDVLRGSNVEMITSEPLLSMRQEFAKIFPELKIKDFSAENIDLPDSSVDAVIAAQCFHWFANNESLSQIQRVLVPGGKLGLIWNSWDASFPWIKELNEEVVLPSYWETNTPHEMSYEWKKVLDASGKFLPVEGDESQFKSQQFFSFEELIDRLTSVSVIQVKNSSEKELMKKRVELIWNKYNEKNKLVFPHVVKIYWAERK